MGKTFLTSHNMLKIQFLKSTPMVIYTASSYDVDKVVFIVRSDFRLPKIIKNTLSPGTVKDCLHEPDLCIVSLTNVLVPSTGVRDALRYGDETQ